MSAALRKETRVHQAVPGRPSAAWVPASLLDATFAPASVLLIVVHITLRWTRFPGELRWAIKATNAELAAALRVSAATVERAMRWLREHHMLRETVAMPGHSPKRYLVFPRGEQFAQVPAQLIASTGTALLIRFAALWILKRIGWQGDLGRLEFTRERIAAELGVTPRTVTKIVADAEEAGWLDVGLRRERGAPWTLQIPSAPPITQEPCAAVRKRLEIAEERAAPFLPAVVRPAISGTSCRGFEEADDGRAELRKRPSTRARTRPRASSSTPNGVEHLDEQVVSASCEPQVVRAPEGSALRAVPADIGSVITGLPESLRSQLPPTLPRRVVQLVERGLRARTAVELVERAHRRWVGGGYAGQELRDAVAVVVSLLTARCGDQRCEDGLIRDAAGFDYACGSCGLWRGCEGAARVVGADGVQRGAAESWRPRGPLHEWGASLAAVQAVPRPVHVDWRQHAGRRT